MVKNMIVTDFIRGFWAEYIIVLDLSLKKHQFYYALYWLPTYDMVQQVTITFARFSDAAGKRDAYNNSTRRI